MGRSDRLETFNPWKVYTIRGNMCYTLKIIYDPQNGFPARSLDMGDVIDFTWSEADKLRQYFEELFAKQPGEMVRTGTALRAERKCRKEVLKSLEKKIKEERRLLKWVEKELRRKP